MKKVLCLIISIVLICLISSSCAEPQVYKAYYPDGTDLYSVNMDDTYTLRLDGFSLVDLSGVTYSLYDTSYAPFCANIAFHQNRDNPYEVAVILNVFNIGPVHDTLPRLFAICDEAFFGYDRYSFAMWNDPSTYPELIFLDDLTEPVETTIAGEPCIKRHARVYLSEDKTTTREPGDPFLYYFPASGYMITVQYTNMTTTEDESKPDELLSSILVWE